MAAITFLVVCGVTLATLKFVLAFAKITAPVVEGFLAVTFNKMF